jgi:hypothetical protein
MQVMQELPLLPHHLRLQPLDLTSAKSMYNSIDSSCLFIYKDTYKDRLYSASSV